MLKPACRQVDFIRPKRHMMAEENRSSAESAARRPETPKLQEAAAISLGSDTDSAHPARTAVLPTAWIGRSLGKYRITGVLGKGGMGTVFRAFDPMIEREVAIKLLPEELAEDETSLARFLSEAKAAGKLNHPNVVA